MIAAIPSDRALVRHSLRGSREAFGRLVERHQPTVFAIALAASRNYADAEDAVQDAFIRAFESLPTLREPHRFGAWVAHIARNRCRDRWRDDARFESLPDALVSRDDTHATVASDEVGELVRNHLQALDETSREILTLYYYAGRNTREIAAVLDISVAAAKKRLERARAAFGENFLRTIGEQPTNKSDAERLKRILLALMATTPAWLVGLGDVGAVGLGAATVTKVAAGLAIGTATVAVCAAIISDSSLAHILAMSAVETTNVVSSAKLTEPSVEVAEYVNPREPVHTTQESEGTLPSHESRELRINQDGLVTSVKEKLTKPVSLVMENEDLEDIVGYVGEFLKFSYVVLPPRETQIEVEEREYGPYVTDGIVQSVELDDVALEQALDTFLQPLGLTFVVEPGYIWVSTPERIREEIKVLDKDRYLRYRTEETLQAHASFIMENEHVTNVLSYVTSAFDANVLVDYRVVAPKYVEPETATLHLKKRDQNCCGTSITLHGFTEDEGGQYAAFSASGGEAQTTATVFLGVGDSIIRFEVQAIEPESGTVWLKDWETGEVSTVVNATSFPPAPLKTAANPGNLPFMEIEEVALEDCLRGLLRILNYDYRIMPGYFLFGPTGPDFPESEKKLQAGAYEPAIADWLESSLDVKVESSRKEPAAFIKAVESSGKKLIGEDFEVVFASPTYHYSTPPTAMFLGDVPMAVLLDAVLSPMDLTWSIDGPVLTIAEADGP